jgi:hypothetical protein
MVYSLRQRRRVAFWSLSNIQLKRRMSDGRTSVPYRQMSAFASSEMVYGETISRWIPAGRSAASQ